MRGLQRRMLTTMLITLPLLAGGCAKVVQEAKAADAELRAALEAAKSQKDPLTAYQQLRARKKEVLTNHNPCRESGLLGRVECVEIESEQAFDAELSRLLESALQGQPTAALGWVFSEACDDDEKIVRIRQKYTEALLAAADKSNGNAADKDLLLGAGRVVAKGNGAIRNARRAVSFFARAWAAGAANAASEASLLFLNMNDKRNAYLWSLRCTGACRRDSRIALDTLQQDLSPEAAKQAQKLAESISVVELDTAGGQPS